MGICTDGIVELEQLRNQNDSKAPATDTDEVRTECRSRVRIERGKKTGYRCLVRNFGVNNISMFQTERFRP